jgi:hypothetical protein
VDRALTTVLVKAPHGKLTQLAETLANLRPGCAAHQAIRAQMLVQPLHPRRQVHVLANGRIIHAVLTPEIAHISRTGVQADAHIEADVAVTAPHLVAEQAAGGEQCQAAAHRAFGVVFARRVGAEDGQEAVAGVLQHLAAMGIDDGGAARQRAVHHGVDVLGVEVLAQPGGTDDVEEQDGDLPERLVGWRGADRRRHIVGQGGQSVAQGGEAGVDDSIAEQATLSLQRLDGGCQLFAVRGHDDRG